mmetsp:Transcript_3754/g.14764  ORF Transcript_3754/g.14764 Transcript_3754/m.14764 type:complete len:517 (+) Transcript_3754:1380-2930(+)
MHAKDERLVVLHRRIKFRRELRRPKTRRAVAHEVLHGPRRARRDEWRREVVRRVLEELGLPGGERELGRRQERLRHDGPARARGLGQSVGRRAPRVIRRVQRAVPRRVLAERRELVLDDVRRERPRGARVVPLDEHVVPAFLPREHLLGAHDLRQQRVPRRRRRVERFFGRRREERVLAREVGFPRVEVEEVVGQEPQLGAPEDIFRRAPREQIVDGVVELDDRQPDRADRRDGGRDAHHDDESDALVRRDEQSVLPGPVAAQRLRDVLAARGHPDVGREGLGEARLGRRGSLVFREGLADEVGVDRHTRSEAKDDGEPRAGERARRHERELGDHAHLDDDGRDDEDAHVGEGRDRDRGPRVGRDLGREPRAAADGVPAAQQREELEVAVRQDVEVVDAQPKDQEGQDLDGGRVELQARVDGDAHAGDEAREHEDDPRDREPAVEQDAPPVGRVARGDDDDDGVDEDEPVREDDEVRFRHDLSFGRLGRRAAAARRVRPEDHRLAVVAAVHDLAIL